MNYLCLRSYSRGCMGASSTRLVPLPAGEMLDHYRIDCIVAASGMATIYSATDITSGWIVAVKFPHFEIECDPVFFDRFKRGEAICTTLSHPAVINSVAGGGKMKAALSKNTHPVPRTRQWDGRIVPKISETTPV